MRKALPALVWLCVALPGAAETTSIAARLPDGRTLHFSCAGKGTPTVLLESGWSGDSGGWPRVMGPLSATTRVCAYDRAGSGLSDGGPLPRDGAAIARDLAAGLRAARISGPYVLVGHSSGGLYVRHFANLRPGAVVGMLLVDSSVEHQERRFAEAFGRGAGSLQPLIERSRSCLLAVKAGPVSVDDPKLKACVTEPPEAAVTRWEARLSELETLSTTTSTGLDTGRKDYGALPLVTLTATKGSPPQVATFWAGLHREIAARSSCADARVVPDSGHLMMKDRPDAILGAAGELIAAARRKACPFPRLP